MMSSASSISTNPLTPYSTTTDVPHGLNIEINWDSSVTSAPAGFVTDVEQVADFYASALQPISSGPITIDVGYGEINGSRLGGAALGESETNLQQVSYYQLTQAYTTYDTVAKTDLSENFPSTQPNGKFYVSDAEAQALGIITTTPTVDGYVGFSSKSNIFDYSTSGTVPSSQYDFVGTVAHEISEVLGRIFLGKNQISAYDFFHYSSNGVHDFAANGGGYFSINGGTTDLANFNTAHGGDGADWGAGGTSISGGSAFDSFDAFGTPGQFSPVTQTDLTVLQALGFQLSKAAVAGNLTPFPASTPTTAQTTVQNTQTTATITSDAFHFGQSANVAPQAEADATNLNHTTQVAEQLASLVTTNAHVGVALAHLGSIAPGDINDANAPHIVQNHFLLH
jgi:hypothetical protein